MSSVYSESSSMPVVFRATFGPSRRSVITDSFFFRLNYRVTATILVVSAWLIIVQAIFQEPTKCTSKANNEGNYEHSCSLTSLFILKHQVTPVENVSGGEGSADQTIINSSYYELGLIILLLQATLFFIPRYIWKVIEGGKMKMLTTELITSTGGTGGSGRRMQRPIFYYRKYFHVNHHYAIHYIFCETLNLVNVALQLQLLHIYIGKRYETNGIFAMLTGLPRGAADMAEQLLSSRTTEISLNELIQAFLWIWMHFLCVYGIFVILYRLAACEFALVRWFSFLCSCRSIPGRTMTVAYNLLNMNDWFVLLMLRQNIDELRYKELILDIIRSGYGFYV